MWAVSKLNQNQVNILLSTEEDHFNDFKDQRGLTKASKTASAFANADGGDLYIGIMDKKEPNRLANLYVDQEAANGCISLIFGLFADGPEFVSCEFFEMAGKGLCVHFIIQKTPYVVKANDGNIYKRQNAADREVKSRDDLMRLELEKGVRSFEDAAVEAYPDEIKGSNASRLFLQSVIPSSENLDNFLVKERLLSENRLRVCALLLFDDNPQSLLPHAGVKLYRYKTLEIEGSREDLVGQPETIEGCVYDVIYKSVKLAKEKIELIPKLSDSGFINIKYPEEAIHEVICNALLHRDYSINDYVHIRIFDNRVEVESPGRLAGPVTVKNILRQRFARNKKLVRLVGKFPSPPNKDVGEGLNTAFRSMQQLNLGKPEIEETEASVIVRLKHEPLDSKADLIKQYLLKNEFINNKKAREICNVQSDSIIRKLFHSMIAAKEIEKDENTRGTGTKYRLPKT